MNNNNININNNNNNINNNSVNDNFIDRMRIFMTVIVISYFLIKALTAPFKILSNKYNYRSIELSYDGKLRKKINSLETELQANKKKRDSLSKIDQKLESLNIIGNEENTKQNFNNFYKALINIYNTKESKIKIDIVGSEKSTLDIDISEYPTILKQSIDINNKETELYSLKLLISNDNSDLQAKDILHDYTPGIWNSELTDFIILIILVLILFIFKIDKNFPKYDGKYVNLYLWIPFIVGMLIPTFFTSIFNSNKTLKDIFNKNRFVKTYGERKKAFDNLSLIELIILGIIAIVILFLSLINNIGSSLIYYVIYSSIIIGICILLYFFKNDQYTYTNLFFNSYIEDEKCKKIQKMKDKYYVVQSTGEVFEPNLAFITWIILLLIPYNNSILLNIINGLLLGYFVAKVSFYGIQYPLVKKSSKFCDRDNGGECSIKDISYEKIEDLKKINDIEKLTSTLKSRISGNTITILGITLIIIIMIFLFLLSR